MSRSELDRELIRVRVAVLLMLLVFGGILSYIWDLQVVRGHQFQSAIVKLSVRRVRLPGMRGRIYDRHGKCLADNRPSHGLAIYFEELREPGPFSKTIHKVAGVVTHLSEVMEREMEVDVEAISKHLYSTRILPLIAWKDLDTRAIARWAERMGPMPGVDIVTEAVRVYPEGRLACHLIGYVGRGGMADDNEAPYDYYLPEMEGKAGFEQIFDEQLRGEAGGELLRIDVTGFKFGEMGRRKPRQGMDYMLALDTRLQRLSEKVLNKEPGSVVILDPNNGDVLAMASYPGYDLNEFIPRISHARWDSLLQDPRKPMLNRPLQEHYPPGSTVKGAVALAALLSGNATPETVYYCPGFIELGGRTMHCGHRSGHGTLNMTQAIERSCNVYFWNLALDMGYAPIHKMFQDLGFGRKTGIGIYEVPGILPDSAWKRKHHHYGWADGDTCNVAIGQGFLNVTPMQLAVLTAALANGGQVVSPRLIRGVRDPRNDNFVPPPVAPPRQLNWPQASLEVVRNGMREVVHGERGTARSARIPGLTYAAKTGTAQYGSPGNRKYRSWMIAFAPYDNPRYAVVVLIDSGAGAGVAAAPRMRLLLQALFPEQAFETTAVTASPGEGGGL